MIPLKLTLKGAVGIKAGMNRDSITLDLAEIPDDSQMVLLKGDNGSGKSTLLSLAFTPWRQPPHIEGSVYDSFSEGDGLRELIWSHGDAQYRSRIEIKKKGKTQTCKCYLHTAVGTKWFPYQSEDNVESDGKASTYDALIERILGPQSLYYLSAFRAQGAATLAEAKDPKQLMRDLLGLEGLAADAVAAHEIVRGLQEEYRVRHAKVDGLSDLDVELETIGIELERSKAQVVTDRERVQAAADALSECRAKLEAELAKTSENENIAALKRELEAQIVEKANAYTAAVDEANNQINKIATECATVRAMCSDKRDRLRAKKDSLNERLIAQRKLLADKEAIEQAMGALEEAKARVATAEQTYRQAQEDATKHRESEHLRTLLYRERDEVIRTGKRDRSHYDDLERRSKFVEQVPCKGAPPYDECPALADAKAAGSMMEPLRETLVGLRKKLQVVDDRLASIKIADTPPNAEHAYSDLEAQRSTLQVTQHQASRHASMVSAEETVIMAEEDLKRCEVELGELELEIAKAYENEKPRIEEIDTRIEALTQDYEKQRHEIQQKIDDLPPLSPEDAVDRALARVRDAEQNHAMHHATERACSNAIARLEGKMSDMEETLSNSTPIREAVEKLGDEIAKWKLLEISLKGVIDLTIEDAGPSIAAIANELLTNAYGPRFSIRMVTQRTLKNGATRETFEISVIDSETGQESPLLTKSGGEVVWLNKALCDAVAIHHQRTVGIQYECAFGDEVEDGLTQERKKQFYHMEREALRLSGYRRKFLVSHDPQAWEMADHVIDVDAMRAT